MKKRVMKNKIMMILGLMLVICAFRYQDTGTIKGRVVPYNAATEVWAVSDKDTGRATVKAAGEFEMKIPAGKYRVIVEGHKPYKTTTKTDIMVTSGAYVDIGDIKLDEGN